MTFTDICMTARVQSGSRKVLRRVCPGRSNARQKNTRTPKSLTERDRNDHDFHFIAPWRFLRTPVQSGFVLFAYSHVRESGIDVPSQPNGLSPFTRMTIFGITLTHFRNPLSRAICLFLGVITASPESKMLRRSQMLVRKFDPLLPVIVSHIVFA